MFAIPISSIFMMNLLHINPLFYFYLPAPKQQFRFILRYLWSFRYCGDFPIDIKSPAILTIFQIIFWHHDYDQNPNQNRWDPHPTPSFFSIFMRYHHTHSQSTLNNPLDIINFHIQTSLLLPNTPISACKTISINFPPTTTTTKLV